MLGFAQLGVVFAQPSPTITTTIYAAVFPPTNLMPLPMVTAWGQDPANNAQVASMGVDFATAVQLHTIVSQEFAELLARSSSAHEPRGGHATNSAEETWGAGSWRQRTLASLYGGASLAAESDGSTPWVTAPLVTSPDQPVPILPLEPWPDQWQQPFPKTAMMRPEASRLLGLARAYNVVDVATLAIVMLPNNCHALDRQATANQIYLASEIALENETCALGSNSNGCIVVTTNNLPSTCQPFSAISPDYSGCSLWSTYRIAPEHALLTASYVADLLEPVCTTLNFPEQFGSGARNLATGSLGTSSVGAAWYHLSSDATFVERSPSEVQPLYGRYAHFYMAPSVNMWNSADSQGYPTYVANGTVAAPSVSEEGRRYLGSSAALAATQPLYLARSVRHPCVSREKGRNSRSHDKLCRRHHGDHPTDAGGGFNQRESDLRQYDRWRASPLQRSGYHPDRKPGLVH
jgi:hypothetical protein